MWRLQRAAQGILTMDQDADWRVLVAPAGTFRVPVHRVATCHRWTSGPGPGVWRNAEGTRAEFSEVLTCGSVWHCPVCAAKITSERRRELIAAIAAWRERGGEVYLVTRTHSHGKHERTLPEQIKEQARALSKAKGTRRARAVAERAGVVGSIRALECTHGEINGWHPHTHELVFAQPGQLLRLRSLRNGWIRYLRKLSLAGMRQGMTRAEVAAQLRDLRRHALTVQDGTYAADYVAKFGMEPQTEDGGRWGPGAELTRGHLKTGTRLTGRTPFTLLRQYVEGDARAGMLFRDFALAFTGRAQLYWSPGLRASLVELSRAAAEQVYFVQGASGVWRAWEARAQVINRDRPDDEIAAARSDSCNDFVARLSESDWRNVLATNSRHELLLTAQLDGAPGVAALLERLRTQRATHRGDFKADWRRWDRGRWRDAA